MKKEKIVTMNINVAQILYEIQNNSHIIAEQTLNNENDNFERAANMQPTEENELQLINRYINIALAECTEMLFPYTKEEIVDSDINCNTGADVYSMALTLPNDFSMTTVTLLRNLIPEYVVCRALANWMSVANPAIQEIWGIKCREVKNKIQSALLSRVGKMKRRLKPF